MNANDCFEILQLPFTEKELYATLQNKTGYHVYLSWFVIQFNQQDYNTKKEVCIRHAIVDKSEYKKYKTNSVVS